MKALKGSYARLPADGSEQLLEWLGKPTLQVSQARAVFFQVQAECFLKGPFFGDLATRGVEIPALWVVYWSPPVSGNCQMGWYGAWGLHVGHEFRKSCLNLVSGMQRTCTLTGVIDYDTRRRI